jgi:hypothetical protein
MEQVKPYVGWAKHQCQALLGARNVQWILLWLIFTLSWCVAGHLLFLRDYKRAGWYVLAWTMLLGAWIAVLYFNMPRAILVPGIVVLVMLLLVDMHYVYVLKSSTLDTSLPWLLILIFFSLQVCLYEYAVDANWATLEERFF